MYLDFKVKIPDSVPGITRKRIKEVTYIYYAYERSYSPERKYTVPKSTSIGKGDAANPGMMYPNANYLKFFPDEELPEDMPVENRGRNRSRCLRTGIFLVLRRIIAEYHLDEMLKRIIGKESGLFLDIDCFTIITECNAGQYYTDYAYNHPLFTPGMKIYSDTKISDFINSIDKGAKPWVP